MVAEIKAWKDSYGVIFETEEKARRSELKRFITETIVDSGQARGPAEDIADLLVNDLDSLATLVVAYKKTLPANALAKEDKEK